MRLYFHSQNILKLFSLKKFLIACVAILVLTFLFIKTQAVNPVEHNRYTQALIQLEEVDATLNQDILKVRQGLLLHYDPLVADLERLKQLLQQLEKIPTFIDGRGQAEVKQRLEAYANVLHKKEILIESFKSQYATLRNSLSYFPIAATRFVETSATSAKEITTNLNILLRDVLIYNLSSSEALAPKIKAHIEHLLASREQYSTGVGDDNFNIAIAHAQTILKNKPQVDALTKELTVQQSLKRAEELYNTYSQYYQAALNNANTYRLYLYLLSIVLLGYIAYFVETLRRIIMQVKKTVNQVNFLVEENDCDIRKLSDDAFQQAQEITLTLNSVEQMAQSIQEVADSARQARAVAHTTSTTALVGSKAMERTVDGFLSLRETLSETTEKFNLLCEASQEISKVISLINQIAMQTRMLSLNASIEAVRAGKEGQGFTVVAQEVGKLAIQSSEATKEIEQLIKNIQRETSVVVKAMELGNTQVLEGTHLVEDAKQNLQQIVEVSRQIDLLVQSISDSTVSQAQTSEAVTNLMKQITDVSKRTSDSSRQVSNSLQQTVAIAQQLHVSVSGFKLATSLPNT